MNHDEWQEDFDRRTRSFYRVLRISIAVIIISFLRIPFLFLPSTWQRIVLIWLFLPAVIAVFNWFVFELIHFYKSENDSE